MTILKRDDILQASDIRKELVSVPEWGGEVYVRGLTGAEVDQYQASLLTANKGQTNQSVSLVNMRAKLCALAICDEAGKLLFTEADARALGEKSGAALLRIFEVAQRLSGLGTEQQQKAKEGLQENPLEDSTSA